MDIGSKEYLHVGIIISNNEISIGIENIKENNVPMTTVNCRVLSIK